VITVSHSHTRFRVRLSHAKLQISTILGYVIWRASFLNLLSGCFRTHSEAPDVLYASVSFDFEIVTRRLVQRMPSTPRFRCWRGISSRLFHFAILTPTRPSLQCFDRMDQTLMKRKSTCLNRSVRHIDRSGPPVGSSAPRVSQSLTPRLQPTRR
jgi:hypothetical protein